MRSNETGRWWRRYWGKRALDIIVAIVLFAFLWPLMGIIAILIKLDSRGPVVFAITRRGYRNRTFRIYKFRTMRIYDESSELVAQKLRDDPRVTRIGAFLRKTSLDELPQLLNVFKGDISLVGVRPLITADAFHYEHLEGAELIGEWLTKRAEFPPGLISPDKLLKQSFSVPSSDKMIRAELEFLQTRSIFTELSMIYKGIVRSFRAEGTL